jgi:plastocyanin
VPGKYKPHHDFLHVQPHPIPAVLRPRRPSAATLIAIAAIAATAATVTAASASRTHPPRERHARAATGRIEGVVEISSAITARRPQFRIYADPGSGVTPAAAPRDPIAEETRNVVLYLEGDSTKLPASAARLERSRHGSISQRDERFAPHILAVMQGATVDFPNQDDVYHNVFSLSSAAGSGGFDLGRYPKGSSRSWTFNRAGTVQVFCHIHSDMSAIVLVLSNPFFALPDEGHRFAIDDVPEGEYTLVAWHERIKPITHRIRVVAGQTAVVDFDIPLPQGGGR